MKSSIKTGFDLERLSWLKAAWGALPGLILGACSSTPVSPLPVLPQELPGMVSLPHPIGNDLSDLYAITNLGESPEHKSMLNCGDQIDKLLKLTQAKDETEQGLRELIRKSPEYYHWCFYHGMLELEDRIKQSPYIDERQKSVVQMFRVLTPLAKGFFAETKDSRYWRYAIYRYKKLSEIVFFRRVEMSPEVTQELAVATNPFGLERPADLEKTEESILAKYGLEIKKIPDRVPSSDSKTEGSEGSPARTDILDSSPSLSPSQN